MDVNDFRDIHLESEEQRASNRPFVVLGSVILFFLFWVLIPPNDLFWIMVFCITVLVWMATYGWRAARDTLVDFLERLD